MTGRERSPQGRWVDSFLNLIWLGWFSAPILVWAGLIESASFFGDLPDPDQIAHARILWYAGIGCAFTCPVLGMIVAGLTGRRPSIWAYAGALTITMAVTGYAVARLNQ
jgi:hypothetical protein